MVPNRDIHPAIEETLPVHPSGAHQPGALIFLLEEDRSLATLIAETLAGAGYRIQIFSNPASALIEAEKRGPALFILETMLAGEGGLEICRKIRSNGLLASTPVIFVTVRSGEGDRILGLDAGADDYVTKPFSPRELLARIRAILRRSQPVSRREPITLGELTLDVENMSVTAGDRAVSLTVSEFRLLMFLIQHAGRVFSREQIVQMVWPGSRFVSPRAVDVCIRRIRAKIEPDPQTPRYVQGVRGVGYRLSRS